jgi:stage V sporulation protein B
MGADGAAVSTTICYGVILVVSLYTYLKAADISISPAPFAAVGYAGILCGAAAYLGADICGRNNTGDITAAIAAVIAGGTVYLISLYLLSVKVKRTKATACV